MINKTYILILLSIMSCSGNASEYSKYDQDLPKKTSNSNHVDGETIISALMIRMAQPENITARNLMTNGDNPVILTSQDQENPQRNHEIRKFTVVPIDSIKQLKAHNALVAAGIVHPTHDEIDAYTKGLECLDAIVHHIKTIRKMENLP